ncbi:hypothetical protein J8J14_03915 [Roseomonas sp. SSH11]|uniref:Uncharacterized protein n=1 Tax=Pararoseomonas baculiformis TaxID=2820812 RepID=A0ABS4ABP5_9PROT|nr:hypothetical protein [Pararoseomonas baculiformis]MBP0443918.1 hypothetical protein [Pararoseomonas baculiformis]
MSRFTKPLAAFATAGAILALAAPASAQQSRYCDGNLTANSFYSNVLSDGTTARVEYHGQFQNVDRQRRVITATMIQLRQVGQFTVISQIQRFELKPFEQKDITLLSVRTNNPGGSGAPSPSQVGQQIRFTCAYRAQ